ncbi:MAG: DNA polymerase III [Treponema sp.]|jgi:DNA polymerase-3 subunit gamma/tau|nr:DNA polymerase III [Treponema sp.]
MFENVLGQNALRQLASDLGGDRLAPSMLFFGPDASGKGSAALELGRALSCEGPDAPWNCSCPACARHRRLLHPDLLLLGPRNFSAEIAASAAAFLRDSSSQAARFLFVRSVRKLLARFSPALWENDPKITKLNPLIEALNEGLEDLDAAGAGGEQKVAEGILADSLKLEAEGVGELIPVDQIRRAAWWTRLAPLGKRKLLAIENADRMRDEARNSLLKILEEPPETATIVLTTAHHEALLPTLLSRLRPYRFAARDSNVEAEVIRKIFRDPRPPAFSGGGALRRYLDSFLPDSGETLHPLAALFAASAAMDAAAALRRSGVVPGEALLRLGSRCAAIAEEAGLGRPLEDRRSLTAKVLEGADKFESRGRFSRFLRSLLVLAGESLGASPEAVAYRDMWSAAVREAETAAGTYNLSPSMVLERLISSLHRSMILHGAPYPAEQA